MAPFARLGATVSATHLATVYSRWGDWFGWVDLAVLIGVLLRLARPPAGAIPHRDSRR